MKVELHSRGFWNGQQDTLFDARVFYPNASYIGPTARRTSRPFTEGTNWPRSESTERELGMSNVVFSRL